jgi:hypothetical protein
LAEELRRTQAAPRVETIADIVTKLHQTGGGAANSIHNRRARGVVLA